MTTVRRIAEFAGVSKSTVSLVLNNKPGVSDEMRQTVMQAVTELETIQADDLLPEKSAYLNTTEHKSQALSIMVLHPPILRSSYVFSEVLQGIQAGVEAFNLQLRLVVNDPDASSQHVSHLYLTDDYLRPDGVLVFGAQQHEPLLEQVIERDIPCVVLGREAKKYHVSGIDRDEEYHAYQLTQHLINLGHRSIAFIGGETCYDYTTNRLKGYQRALEDATIAPDERWVYLGDGTVATEHILDANLNVTAMIYVNDSYAIEGLAVLRERGIKLPTEISVASFDDTEFSRDHQPPLTSVSYNLFKEGQWAVKILLDQIRHPFIAKSHLVFNAELLIRESTAPPPTL